MKTIRTFCLLVATVLAVAAAAGPARANDVVSLETVFTAAVERVSLSVVGVTVEWKPGKTVIPAQPGRQAFRRPTGPLSGVILTPDGCIVTSDFNVNEDTQSVKVTLIDGREFPAQVLGRDVSRGIQLLRIEATDLPVPAFSSNGDITVGRWALACGVGGKDALPMLSVGIVSATERIRGRMIQFDASTNPTNYGGPLVDIEGRVMGVITPLTEAGTDAGIGLYDSGIGFAAPADDILKQLARLKAGETVHSAFLGIRFDMRQMQGGARIQAVLKDTGAEKAGIKEGDVITEFNGIPIHTSFKLLHAIGACRVGEVVKFKVLRAGKEIELEATLGARPTDLR